MTLNAPSLRTAALLVLSLPALPAHAAPPDTVRVRADGKAVAFQAGLDAGALYLLRAAGTVQAGPDRVDAEGNGPGTGVDLSGAGVGGAGAGAPAHWFGPPRPDHTYYAIVDGDGRPLTLRLATPGGATGRGAITVSLSRLSPAPASLPKPLETLPVPVLERTTATALTTRPDAVYLLECAGDGRVGGGGLGRGDAEFMDYRADGTGREDIGDANTDYGLGVDEADQGVSPRRHKWGLWRKDHTYFMLYQGTGRPLHFFFYDVKGGYGDNSPTDTLTVTVFALP